MASSFRATNFRRVLEEAKLLDRATVLRQGTATKGAQGGVIAGEQSVRTDRPCRLEPLGANNPIEREIANRLSLVNPAVVVFAHDEDVIEQDVIIIAGQTFNARGVLPQGVTAIVKRVVCEQVK